MSHPSHDLFENRTQFQLERMILFSDAVFAIAITLLIIEIKIPDLDAHHTLGMALRHSWYEFFGLFLSFAVIGQFWVSHHRLFGFVNNFDGRLLWLNLHVLFWIILMPFSSALNSRYGNMDSVWMFYSFNMFMIAMAIYAIWRYICNPKRNLSELAHDAHKRKWVLRRSLVIAIIFVSGLLLCLFDNIVTSIIARFIFALIFPAMAIISRKANKKKSPAQ